MSTIDIASKTRRKKVRLWIFIGIILGTATITVVVLSLLTKYNSKPSDSALEITTFQPHTRDISETLLLTGTTAAEVKPGTSTLVYSGKLDPSQITELTGDLGTAEFSGDFRSEKDTQRTTCEKITAINLDPSDPSTDLDKPVEVSCTFRMNKSKSPSRKAYLYIKSNLSNREFYVEGKLSKKSQYTDSFHIGNFELNAHQYQQAKRYLKQDQQQLDAQLKISGIAETTTCTGKITALKKPKADAVALFQCPLEPHNQLVTGLNTKATLTLATSKDATVVDKNGIRILDATTGVVTLVHSDGRQSEKTVQLGLEDSLGIEVVRGLQPESEIVDLASIDD